MNKLLLTASFLFCFSHASLACEIVIKTERAQNGKVFSIGEQVTIYVQVKHIHRVCRLDIEDTTIEEQGLKVLKSTKWQEVSPGLWEQMLVMKVTGSRSGPLRVRVTRDCPRGFHEAELTLLSKNA